MTTVRNSPLRRLSARLHRDTTAPEADVGERVRRSPTRDDAAVTRIRDVLPRQRITVAGEVRTVSLRPQGDVPTLEVELWDETGALHLVWLGRRRIVGIVPGIRLRATGRVTEQRRALTIFNPAYEVVGTGGSAHG